MKKKYINPTMEVIKIKTSHQLLAGSVGMNGLDGLGDYGGEVTGRSADAREFDINEDFDEDFDEDL